MGLVGEGRVNPNGGMFVICCLLGSRAARCQCGSCVHAFVPQTTAELLGEPPGCLQDAGPYRSCWATVTPAAWFSCGKAHKNHQSHPVETKQSWLHL